MATVTILPETTKNPITLIGQRAGICWGADISDPKKNYERGLHCIESMHGRTLEFVNVEMVLSDCSARVIREWYTHIGCLPSRLQESTRYVDCEKFNYVVPPSILNNPDACQIYMDVMRIIGGGYKQLTELGISKEDSAMVLPLGMTTKVVDKRNLRNLIDMSRQRMCNRAYSEYRLLFNQICIALSEYSEEWNTIIERYMHPKCEELGYCPEQHSCGRMSNERP